MNNRKLACCTWFSCIAFWGCDSPSSIDLSSVMAPIESRNSVANTYSGWQPSEQQRASLTATQESCEGSLQTILDSAKWSGHRLRVTGVRNGTLVTENIGPWHIIFLPTPNRSIVEIKGLLFAANYSITLDMERDVLTVNGVDFKGRPVSGNSPMFNGTRFQGVVFEKHLGLTMGSASILVLEDGRLCLDFHKVIVNGLKAGEYGVLNASATEESNLNSVSFSSPR